MDLFGSSCDVNGNESSNTGCFSVKKGDII